MPEICGVLHYIRVYEDINTAMHFYMMSVASIYSLKNMKMKNGQIFIMLIRQFAISMVTAMYYAE